MYLLIITTPDEYYPDTFELFLFTSYQNAEDWINTIYKNQRMPQYTIEQFHNIDASNVITEPVILQSI